MAEWPIVQHWKCCVRETGPGVRIPLSPHAEIRSPQVPNSQALAGCCFFPATHLPRICPCCPHSTPPCPEHPAELVSMSPSTMLGIGCRDADPELPHAGPETVLHLSCILSRTC